MKIKVRRWGNSLAIRLPAPLMREMGVEYGSTVDLVSTDRGLLIRPATLRYSLDDLVSGIDEKNLHEETDWGSPAGKEAW